MAAAIRNLGSSKTSSKGFFSERGSRESLSGRGKGVSGGGGPSNKKWTRLAASVMKDVDVVISLMVSEGIPGGSGLKISSLMSSWYLLFWSRYFHFLVGKWKATGCPFRQ